MNKSYVIGGIVLAAFLALPIVSHFMGRGGTTADVSEVQAPATDVSAIQGATTHRDRWLAEQDKPVTGGEKRFRVWVDDPLDESGGDYPNVTEAFLRPWVEESKALPLVTRAKLDQLNSLTMSARTVTYEQCASIMGAPGTPKPRHDGTFIWRNPPRIDDRRSQGDDLVRVYYPYAEASFSEFGWNFEASDIEQ
jgi:hypothetical protein